MKNLLIITQKVDKNDQLLGFFIEWIALFAQKFEKITVLCLEKGKYNLPSNIRVFSMGKDKGASKFKLLFNFYFLLFATHKDYDSVLVHMNPLWVVLGGWYWHLTQKKIFFWYTSGGVTTKLKLAEKFADTIFTASSESFRLSSNKVIVTGHGINTELFKPSKDTEPDLATRFSLKILSVGRIAPVKNYETLIGAAKILTDKNVVFSITIVGEAPLKRDKKYEENLKSEIKNLKLKDNFNFIGKVDRENLPAYYQSHDIFVHLSKTGSLDKTLLEAMSCGIRVLSSNDAARSFLPENLIFEEDNPPDLANKIIEIKNSAPETRLRDYVVENHNLNGLVNKISKIMNV